MSFATFRVAGGRISATPELPGEDAGGPERNVEDMGASKNVLEVTDATFDAEVLKADKPVLVDFGATWCGPCKALAPVVDKLADETVGKYKIVKVDIDDAPGVAQKYGIPAACPRSWSSRTASARRRT